MKSPSNQQMNHRVIAEIQRWMIDQVNSTQFGSVIVTLHLHNGLIKRIEQATAQSRLAENLGGDR